MFERQLQHHIPALLLLWRAATVTMHTSARRAADARTRSLSTAVTRRGPNQAARSEAPLLRAPRQRLPLPSPTAGPQAAAAAARCPDGAARYRALSHWAAMRSRLFPALRMALPMAAACAALAAGSHGHYQQQQHVLGLHGSGLPYRAPFATHGSLEPAVCTTPADVRAAREVLQLKGFDHPGMQPGAAWGAVPTDGGSSGSRTEMHAMFELLLLFPC